MKFEEKYPNAKHNDEPEMLIVCFKDSPPKPCWHCNALTVFVEISFEAHLCSEECVAAKWKEYEEACRRPEERKEAARSHGSVVSRRVGQGRGLPTGTPGSQKVREPELPGDQKP